MPEAPAFAERSVRFDLPFLFSGQAQREFYINESLARIDALLHPAVDGELAQPPSAPARGQAYIIAAAATGNWAGRTGQIASWDGQQWTYVAARPGMRVYDTTSRLVLRFRTAWERPASVANPQNGTVVDVEARAAITQLLDVLRKQGLVA